MLEQASECNECVEFIADGRVERAHCFVVGMDANHEISPLNVRLLNDRLGQHLIPHQLVKFPTERAGGVRTQIVKEER